MCVDLTLSNDDDPNVKQAPIQGLHVDMGDAKIESSKPNKTPIKTRKKMIVSRGKDILKGLEVDFDVSDSDPNDCTIVQSPTQSTINWAGVNVPKENNTQVEEVCLYCHTFMFKNVEVLVV